MRLQVRVSWTVLDTVTLALAAHAPLVDRRGGLVLVTVIVFIILLDFVLAVFAALGFFGAFAATPPHVTRPFGLMRATAPVEVFLFNVFFAALSATLLVSIDLAPPPDLCEAVFQTLFLIVEYGVHLDDLRHLFFVLRQGALGIFEVAVKI